MLREIWRVYMSAAIIGAIIFLRFWARFDMV
jgi:hypothetical protein